MKIEDEKRRRHKNERTRRGDTNGGSLVVLALFLFWVFVLFIQD